jgi:tetratricopeptide (TPR) repeat protein
MKFFVGLVLCLFSLFSLKAQKSVAVYWDASYSMKDRVIEREITFLDNYFKKNSEANVTFIMFSNDILLKTTYLVKNSNWLNLKKDLLETIYDGSTSYSFLFKDEVEEYLLFTDGLENTDKLQLTTSKPIFIISSKYSNIKKLNVISKISSGRFVYLNSDAESTIENMEELQSSVRNGFITGNVSGFEGNLYNVNIVNKNSNKGVSSDSQGNFKIKANQDDILVFSFLGKKTVRVRIDKANIINITMINITEDLDSVIINTEVEKENLINTGNGLQDKKRLGYDVKTIGSDVISDLDTDVQQAVKGQFAGLQIQNDTAQTDVDLSQFLGRGKNMTILGNQYGLIVVDGVPTAQSNSSTGFKDKTGHLDPSIIHSITYLKGLAATNKYGTLGRNGVLLITTKNAVLDADTTKKKKPLGTTATYSGNAQTISKLANVPYINTLKSAKTVDEAFSMYLQQRNKYGDNPTFYVDVYDYFKGWNNPLLSKRILSNIYEIAFNNADALKVMAYKQQESGNYKDAVKTFEHIAVLNSKQSQSFHDLALANVYVGNYEEANIIYKKIDNNSIGNTDFSGLKKTLTNETKNLVAQHKSALNLTGINPKYLNNIKYKSRIVFEWNNLDAEFDLNIINPQNRFFTWSHTQAENSQRIFEEKEQGYGLEEYFLTSSDIGEWKFNITYYGKTSKSKTPTFIKITTYNNFGFPNQSKTIEVVRLDKKDVEQTVTKLVVN